MNDWAHHDPAQQQAAWPAVCQRILQAALLRVKKTLYDAALARGRSADSTPLLADVARQLAQEQAQLGAPDQTFHAALSHLCAAFALSSFERDVILLCVGVELDPAFRSLCLLLSGSSIPSFSLALSVLPEPQLTALLPESPLRQARLLEVGGGDTLTLSTLRLDERILHFLIGVERVDHRLSQLGELRTHREPADDTQAGLAPSLRQLVEQLGLLLQKEVSAELPVLSLFGGDVGDRDAVAQAVCQDLGLWLYRLRAADLHEAASAHGEREKLTALCVREQHLLPLAVYVCIEDGDSLECVRGALRFADALPGLVLLSSPAPLRMGVRRRVSLEVPKLSTAERAQQLRLLLAKQSAQLDAALGPGGSSLLLELAQHFRLGRTAMTSACLWAQGSTEPLSQSLWHACRQQARPHLDDLARRVIPRVTWDDLVLPPAQLAMLKQLVAHQRHQATVYLDWGMATASQRGLGVTALLVGQSGTGKTLAAEAIAHELQLDLYHIDLSQLVSKYIGETEKNLRRVFDAAEEGGAVLLFDEADALFGKRSEVKDSHDRYANMEVSYLLQRMESYQGISLLTSNLRSALDSAFLRRLRFIVPFPFPDAPQRAVLWRRAFPSSVPTEGLSFDKLSRLSVTGGQIRNIALCAAFLAVSAQRPVTMQDILQAARSEYEKSERPLSESETRGWV